jgi:hypothetical protein
MSCCGRIAREPAQTVEPDAQQTQKENDPRVAATKRFGLNATYMSSSHSIGLWNSKRAGREPGRTHQT